MTIFHFLIYCRTQPGDLQFTVGLFAGLGEFHPALCATNFHGLHKGMVAGIWADLVHYANTCEGETCGDGVVFFGVLNLLLSGEILDGLPTECQASRRVIQELKNGVDAIKRAESHTIGNVTLLALASIEQSTRIKSALDLFRLGHPWCAGYQTSVALQRILEEPVLNKTSRNNTSHRFASARKFTIGFVNGVSLAPMVDIQCVSSLRWTAPSLVEDLVKPSIHSLYNIYDSGVNAIAECIPPQFFAALEGGHEETHEETQKVLVALKNPRLVYDMMNEHPLEISANLFAMGLAAKNGDWGRSGEEFGKMVGHLVNLTSIFNSAVHV